MLSKVTFIKSMHNRKVTGLENFLTWSKARRMKSVSFHLEKSGTEVLIVTVWQVSIRTMKILTCISILTMTCCLYCVWTQRFLCAGLPSPGSLTQLFGFGSTFKQLSAKTRPHRTSKAMLKKALSSPTLARRRNVFSLIFKPVVCRAYFWLVL